MWNLDPFLAVINTQDPLELSHHGPVRIAFIANHLPFFPCLPEALICFLATNILALTVIALSWPQWYLVCICVHLWVLACKSLISAVQQLYVMTSIVCCVTARTARSAVSMLTHDRSTAPAVAAVEDGVVVCVFVTLGNLVATEK